MANGIERVDPFHGNFETAVEKRPPGTPAEGWQWLKALPGNTHPGACRPFGLISACAYTGGYTSGYSPYAVNCGGTPEKLLDSLSLLGLTHIQPNGIGMTKRYQNFLLVTPFAGDDDPAWQSWAIQNEQARPGFYGVDFGETGVRDEVTVSPGGAMHRLTFPAEQRGRFRLDLMFSYRGDPRFADCLTRRGLPADAPSRQADRVAWQRDGRRLSGTISLADEFPLHVCCEVDVAGSWSETPAGPEVGHSGDAPQLFFQADQPGPIQLKIGFSLRSVDQAREHLAKQLVGWDFQAHVARAAEAWADLLARVQIDEADDTTGMLLSTAIYRCLIKPVDLTAQSPLWDDDRPLYLDFATLWDQYKYQLPMIFTFFPERAAGIVESLVNLTEYMGRLQNAYLIEPDLGSHFNDQGTALACPAVGHAAAIGIDGVNWDRALKVLGAGLDAIDPPSGKKGIDYAYAAFSLAQVARRAGDPAAEDKWLAASEHWKKQYTAPAAKVQPGPFYEGDSWTYSYAVWQDVEGLIAMHGGREAFLRDLDCFFCIPGATLRHIHVEALGSETLPEIHRFEGLNNEPDMDVPAMYIYAGRHDRFAEVVRCVMRHRFIPGRGGLPGNEDSGGLSSWYWANAIGLLPVAGQDRYLIGSPAVRKLTLQIGHDPVTLTAKDNSETNIYVRSVIWRGERLTRPYLTIDELRTGGELVLQMTATPTEAFWR